MTTNFYLDSKVLGNNEKNLICFVRGIETGKTTYIKTNISIVPDLWNPRKQEVRHSHPDYAQLNSHIDKLSREIRALYLDYIDKNKRIDLKIFKTYLYENLFNKPEPEKCRTLYDVFDKYEASKKNSIAISSYKKFKTLKNHLKNFEKFTKTDISFEKVDAHFFDEFIKYGLKNANLTNNSISKLINQFKTFLFWAYEHDFHVNLKFKNFRVREDKVDFVYLTENELLKLVNLDLNSNLRLNNVRDVFCLSCFTGVRFSDISNLDFNDIKDGTWHLRTQKTKDPLSIPLTDYALDILNKYIDSGKQLPVISNQKSNQYLKELCKLAEIEEIYKIIRYKGAERIEIKKPKHEFVGTHTARRTFVILSLEKGMRAETVMAVTGHKDYKTFKKYILISSKVKHDEMRNIWNN